MAWPLVVHWVEGIQTWPIAGIGLAPPIIARQDLYNHVVDREVREGQAPDLLLKLLGKFK
jgi:hypothetical protein